MKLTKNDPWSYETKKFIEFLDALADNSHDFWCMLEHDYSNSDREIIIDGRIALKDLDIFFKKLVKEEKEKK